MYTRNTKCRICGSLALEPILDLGEMPLANAYLTTEQLTLPEATYPLSIHFCTQCSLVQVLDVVDPNILFQDYHFMTGASKPSVTHFDEYADMLFQKFLDGTNDLVVDIGGNDGTFLSFVGDVHTRVLNVDPADNLAELSEINGVPFYPALFSTKVAKDILATHGAAKVITANNVFAHTDNLIDAFRGVQDLLADDGMFIFEVHWVKNLIENNCFDQIYHEHLCYHSLHALQYLVDLTGMHINDVEIVSMQGESLRVYVSKNPWKVTGNVQRILDIEKDLQLTSITAYQHFKTSVEYGKQQLLNYIATIPSHKKIAAYGAPAKGNTLLNYYRIGPAGGYNRLDYAVDSTPLKQGLYTPGMHLPIISPEEMRQSPPDYFLLLAWNFTEAILQQEQALRDKGVKFIIPLPLLTIL